MVYIGFDTIRDFRNPLGRGFGMHSLQIRGDYCVSKNFHSDGAFLLENMS